MCSLSSTTTTLCKKRQAGQFFSLSLSFFFKSLTPSWIESKYFGDLVETRALFSKPGLTKNLQEKGKKCLYFLLPPEINLQAYQASKTPRENFNLLQQDSL